MKTVAYVTMEPELIPRMELQARTLLDNNYKVIHIGWDRRKDHPKEEVANGVRFIRIAPYLSTTRINSCATQSGHTFWGVTGQNGLRNLKNLPLLYLNFLKALAKEQPDIIHCTHVGLLPVALFFAKIKKKKIIYEAVEFYISQSFASIPSLLRFLKRFAIYLEGLLVRYVDYVICIPSAQNRLFRTYLKNNSFVREILNVPNLACVVDQELYNDLKFMYTNRKVFVYAGAISAEKGILNLVMAINRVRISHPEVKLVLIGSSIGDDTQIITKYIEENGLEQFIEIVSFQPYSKLYTYYSAADFGIGLLEKRIADKFTKGGSRKLMEYMKASLPILVTIDGDVGSIVKEEECGVLANIWDEADLVDKINWLLDNPLEAKKMGERGRIAFQYKYNWNEESKKLMDIYNIL